MKQEHHPKQIRSLNGGVNSDVDKEFVGSVENGQVIEMRNGRVGGVKGNEGAAEKIGGETQAFGDGGNVNADGYVNIGAITVNDKNVEVWAHTSLSDNSLIRVNGTVVLKSALFNAFDAQHPLQMDANSNVLGGEIMFTNNKEGVPPMILNVQDMQDSRIADPDKYFSAFNPDLYYINIQSPLDMPVFIGVENVGGGGGLPVGGYEYEMRYSTKDGEKTNWSQRTPLIPVVQNLNNHNTIYPGYKTYADEPNPSKRTRYAIKIKFRVTNLFDYDFIEIKRIEHNQGAGIGFQPIEKIVAKIDVSSQEISVREFIDPSDADAEIIISDKEAVQELAYIERAKSIRYHDLRTVLMNVKVASKEADLEFKTVDGQVMFPVIDKLGKTGFTDPWNQVYRKAFMGGENYGFAVNLFDGIGGRGFAVKSPGFTNYSYPNRRNVANTTTKNYSYNGVVRAATTETGNAADETFEVFDLADAVAKSDTCSFKNIYKSEGFGATGFKATTKVNFESIDPEEFVCGDPDDGESNSQLENHGTKINFTGTSVHPYYHPYTPTRPNDPAEDGLNYVVNTTVGYGGIIGDPNEEFDYRPKGFAPNYFSHGMAMSGIDNIPKWAKAFSVVRSDAAGRVVSQGIGFYQLNPAEFTLAGADALASKSQEKLWFFSPDIENGFVSSDTVNDMINNPENYQIQLVSPLGFFSEVYNFENRSNPFYSHRDLLVDMMVYARIIRDTVDGEINPESSDMGESGGDSKRYVQYGKYRNDTDTQDLSAYPVATLDGDKLFDIARMKRVKEGRGSYIEIEAEEAIYGSPTTGGFGNEDYNDNGMKNFTEPFYIVNIIQKGAAVRDQNINKYRATTHYQKIESIIGASNGAAGQEFELVDERWEDCIPSINSTAYGASTERHLYIKNLDGTEKKYVNVTFKTSPEIDAINADILANGFYNDNVTGIYTHENINDANRFFKIKFNLGYTPATGSFIVVRYDNTAPIRFWGGDSFVGESIFAPIDRESDAEEDAATTQFALGIGFPLNSYEVNPRHFIIQDAAASVNAIQDETHCWLGYIRQMCVMFCVESRLPVHLSHSVDYPLQFFPQVNYVMRPNRWDKDKLPSEQNIYSQYETDYPNEHLQWKWGGLRFRQNINFEYANDPPKIFFSKPLLGFEEKTDFYTRVMHSFPRAINSQNSPGLRSFPALNAFDINDDTGEIKKAYDCLSGPTGNNLYAITNNGVCLLLTKKSVLSDLNGGDIGYMASDKFISGQHWITKEIGMNDEFWRSAVECNAAIETERGQIRKEALFFANYQGVYRIIDNAIMDISRHNYYNQVVLGGVANVGFNTKLAAGYDHKNQEYWLMMKTIEQVPAISKCFVYNQKNQFWNGYNDFQFDMLNSNGDYLYGMRKLKTFITDSGYLIDGAPVVFEVTIANSPNRHEDKEFIRVRINASDKPTKVSFLEDETLAETCSLAPTQGALYLKDYRGYEQFIPRKDTTFSVNRELVQGRLLLWKIRHDAASAFKIIDTSVQYKVLK